jgi:hypothetical protein
MKTTYRIPHVEAVEVPTPRHAPHLRRRAHQGAPIPGGGNEGNVFAPLEDLEFFAQVTVDPETRTVVWPNDVNLDPAVLHGDFDPAGISHFRDVTPRIEPHTTFSD